MRTILLSLFMLFSFATTDLFGQIVLIPDPTIVVPDDCITISELSSLTFMRDPSCGGTIRIADATGATTLETYGPGVTEFSYQFDTPGEYVVLCNSSVMADIDDTAVCIVVTPMVPTMSEWSVIILALMILICFAVSIRSIQELPKRTTKTVSID